MDRFKKAFPALEYTPGDQLVLDWMARWTRAEVNADSICELAALSHCYEVMFWGIQKGFKCDQETIIRIAERGRLDVLVDLEKARKSFGAKVLNAAIKSRNMELVMWLIKEHKCPTDNDTFYIALYCFNNDFTLLNILKSSCHDPEGAYEVAIDKRDISLIRWLNENHFSWTSATFSRAVAEGDMEILQYMRDNDCPIDHQAILATLRDDKVDIFKWLLKIGCPLPS